MSDATSGTWVLRPLGVDPRGRVGFIVNPDASPEELAAALRQVVDEMEARRNAADPPPSEMSDPPDDPVDD